MTNYTGPGVIPSDHDEAMTAARRRIFDVNAAAFSRATRQLAMPVAVTCADCGAVCLDETGAERMTRDRAMREDFCANCKSER